MQSSLAPRGEESNGNNFFLQIKFYKVFSFSAVSDEIISKVLREQLCSENRKFNYFLGKNELKMSFLRGFHGAWNNCK